MAVAAVVASELPGDTLPSAVGIFEHVIAAAHQIKERPIVEALVRVVQTVDAAKVIAGRPQYRAVWAHVALHERMDRGVHQID